jgi:site-specific DNA-methyltransferase (adenine-specific)
MVAGCEDNGLEIRDQLLWLHGRGVPKSRVLSGGVSTTLKPAFEPILLARAPLAAITAQANIERHGTGGLNVNACRLARPGTTQDGYWPSQLVLSHEQDCNATECCSEDCAVAHLDGLVEPEAEPLSRLFYVGKAAQSEREAGLDELPHSDSPIFSSGRPLKRPRANVHPTVKPIDVMRWLVRLITPQGGLVLDPFTGSGSTGCATVLEGRRFIGIERDRRYVPVARARLAHWTEHANADLGPRSERDRLRSQKSPISRQKRG